MLTRTIEWLSLPLLLIATIFTHFAANYEFLLNIAICQGALIVVHRTFRAKEYFLAGGFVAIAIVFCPLPLIFKIFLLLSFTCISAFVALLDTWKTSPAPAA
jgi:hypothetical protein